MIKNVLIVSRCHPALLDTMRGAFSFNVLDADKIVAGM